MFSLISSSSDLSRATVLSFKSRDSIWFGRHRLKFVLSLISSSSDLSRATVVSFKSRDSILVRQTQTEVRALLNQLILGLELLNRRVIQVPRFNLVRPTQTEVRALLNQLILGLELLNRPVIQVPRFNLVRPTQTKVRALLNQLILGLELLNRPVIQVPRFNLVRPTQTSVCVLLNQLILGLELLNVLPFKSRDSIWFGRHRLKSVPPRYRRSLAPTPIRRLFTPISNPHSAFSIRFYSSRSATIGFNFMARRAGR